MKFQNLPDFSLSLPLLSLLVSSGQCTKVESPYYPPAAICTEVSLPVYLNGTTGYVFNPALKWTNNDEAAQFVANTVGRDPTVPAIFTGAQNFTRFYAISATFCTPRVPIGDHAETVLLASHCIGYDRSYWNIALEPEKYNFVQFAIACGYSIFFFDRLGTGLSSNVTGFENQLSLQLDTFTQITSLVRSGSYTGPVGVPKSIVLLGHSFGSILSHGHATIAPKSIDGVMLTGYSTNASFWSVPVVFSAWQPRIASQVSQAWAGYDAGHVTWPDLFADVLTFFKFPYYTHELAAYFELRKKPFAITELLTATPTLFPVTNFTGPVLLIAGTYDFLVCNGYCADILDRSARQVFVAARNLTTYLQPGMGHGMNFHNNATGYYKVVTDFLIENGF